MSESLAYPSPSTRNSVGFCPACWEQISASESNCSRCGTDIVRYLAERDYGLELIDGLVSADTRRRLTAAWVLGERREMRAVPSLRQVAMVEKHDIYFAKAAVTALAKIGGADATEAVRIAADHHPARLVRQAARQVLQQSFLKQ